MATKHETMENPFAATNAIQVRIDDNVRMLSELHARWEREDEMARNSICTITTTSNVDASKSPKVPIPFSNKNAEILRNMGNNNSTTLDANFDFDLDGCNNSEVIMFLQKLARIPNGSAMNMAFTKHITNSLMKIKEEKLKHKASIHMKLEDGWEPIINIKVNDFDLKALCDLGASVSIMPRKIYEML